MQLGLGFMLHVGASICSKSAMSTISTSVIRHIPIRVRVRELRVGVRVTHYLKSLYCEVQFRYSVF